MFQQEATFQEMSQWTSVCTHAHTDYGLASSLKIVDYAVTGKPVRPCVHVAMVTVQSVGTPNVTRLRELARKHPHAVTVKVRTVNITFNIISSYIAILIL